MKKILFSIIFLLLTFVVYGQSKQDILNNLQRGGAIDIQDASPDATYDILMWDGDELKLVTVTVLSTILPSATIEGDITLENGEIISNSTDGDVFVIYDDDAATLGQFFIQSTNDTANLSDNDNLELLFRFYDDSLGATDWGVIKTTATDVSDESEDSKMEFKVWTAGTQYIPLTIAGKNSITVGDTTTGDVDNIIYFATNGDAASENITWDDGLSTFTLSDGLKIADDLIVNDAGADVDIKFESDGQDSAFVLNGADGLVHREGSTVQDGSYNYGVDTSATEDAYKVVIASLGSEGFTAGTIIWVDLVNGTGTPADNTGACTLTVNSNSTIAIKDQAGGDPAAGFIDPGCGHRREPGAASRTRRWSAGNRRSRCWRRTEATSLPPKTTAALRPRQ